MAIQWTKTGLTSMPAEEAASRGLLGIFTVAHTGSKWSLRSVSAKCNKYWGGFSTKARAQQFAEAVVIEYGLQLLVVGAPEALPADKNFVGGFKDLQEEISRPSRRPCTECGAPAGEEHTCECSYA